MLSKNNAAGLLAFVAACGVADLDPLETLDSAEQELGLVGVRINEVESNGGVPGDWVELLNTNAETLDVSGWKLRDNDNSHTYVIPAGTAIESGGFLVLDEAIFGFGLGAGDMARLFDPGEALIDSYTWTSHAASTYGRCPDGTGAFRQTNSTKGAANDCSGIRINEVESNGGVPGDWVELTNLAPTAIDVSGWVFKDNDDSHAYVIPAGTSIAPGAYLVLNEVVAGAGQFNFGLGAADSARIYDAGSSLADAFSWTAHAAVTYGRCPNGTGPFTSTPSTKGAANSCGPPPTPTPAWPGKNTVTSADGVNILGNNLSDLFYDDSVVWAVRNNPSILHRLVPAGAQWTPDTGDWSAGKTMRYPDGTGVPDAEGVTRAELSSPAIYVATERDNNNGNTSRLSILRFDTEQAGTVLTATHEWELTADLPVVGSNLGLESLTWIPDDFLVGAAFFADAAGHPYDPSEYADHGGGLFFTGLEGNGVVYVYALDHVSGDFTRVATFSSGNAVGKALSFDRDTGYLWASCGVSCGNQVQVLTIDPSPTSPTSGRFRPLRAFAGPSSMPSVQNEGTALAPESQCAGGFKTFLWSDDANTLGHALRADSIPCGRFIDDPDGDGILDPNDNCPSLSNADQLNTDGDALGNACDADDDNDGIADAADNCVLVANASQLDADTDGRGDACDACPLDASNDTDGDGVCANADNCPTTANATQANADGDGQGDACDVCPADASNDADGDGFCANEDNCPATANQTQADADGDGAGNACDACPADASNDVDGDGFCANEDNCPTNANETQADADGDGAGDACDVCALDPDNDADADGFCAGDDNCPTTANATQANADGDGQGDACDVCPLDPSDDADGDGFCANADNCPTTANETQADADGDGAGDACDVCSLDPDNDADADGFCADTDNCPAVANDTQADADADGAGDACDHCWLDPDDDADADGLCADADNCPLVSNPDQADGDADGTGDSCDADNDNDGVSDAGDACLGTAAGAAVNVAGCSIAQIAPCDGGWRNHTAYVVATVRAVLSFIFAGLVTPIEGAHLVVEATHSSCGR